MSGHSKWSQIKRQKGANDVKRGALFTKLSREIIVAAKTGGADPEMNFRLRLAVQKAREANMPADNIDRAIKKASGGADAAELVEVTYEGYGPNGIAIIVEALTDNRNRTVAEVRSVFTRGGGNLGESGSVAWQFANRGIVAVNANGKDPEEITLAAIDAGAEDFDVQDDMVEIYTTPASLEAVRKAVLDAGYEVASAELSMLPSTPLHLEGSDADQVLKLLERLENLDDVQQVYSNAEFSEEAIAAYSA
jgi:YebC/PmpR family DNA-binding regulatory protein